MLGGRNPKVQIFKRVVSFSKPRDILIGSIACSKYSSVVLDNLLLQEKKKKKWEKKKLLLTSFACYIFCVDCHV